MKEKEKIIAVNVIFWGVLVPACVTILGFIGLVGLYAILIQ
jgi:hypothetical protein